MRLNRRIVAVSGSHGLVGRALIAALKARGDDVRPIVRCTMGQAPAGCVAWDTSINVVDSDALRGCDAVVHLAGEPILGRWDDAKKKRIYASRIDGTRAVSRAIAELARKTQSHRAKVKLSDQSSAMQVEDALRVADSASLPQDMHDSGRDILFDSSMDAQQFDPHIPALIVASAIGIYGMHASADGKWVDESSASGSDFLAQVCVDWEAAAEAAVYEGARVVHLRTGLVLASDGGAIKQMLPAFRLGLGGPIGKGRQWMSWVTLDDLVGMYLYAIDHRSLNGPVNAVAPDAVTNKAFSRTLGRVLKRPALLPVPKFLPRLIFGREMVNALLGSSVRVWPVRLEEAGFLCGQPALTGALREVLGK